LNRLIPETMSPAISNMVVCPLFMLCRNNYLVFYRTIISDALSGWADELSPEFGDQLPGTYRF
jgi:hypothetical protein